MQFPRSGSPEVALKIAVVTGSHIGGNVMLSSTGALLVHSSWYMAGSIFFQGAPTACSLVGNIAYRALELFCK
eukprot:4179017-Prymnesium_polylepis.1